jgi:hypothetical protein
MTPTHLAPIRKDLEIAAARETLTAFVLGQHAVATSDATCFSWEPAPDAPERFEALSEAYKRSSLTGQPLPISATNNDSTIYVSALANVAFRFWHDVHHVRLVLSFELVDELPLALWHLEVLERSGLLPSSLPWRLLQADLIGQTTVVAFNRRFPVDQHRPAQCYVTEGCERNLLAELRRAPDGTSHGKQ